MRGARIYPKYLLLLLLLLFYFYFTPLCSRTFNFLEVVHRYISGKVVDLIPSFSAVYLRIHV